MPISSADRQVTLSQKITLRSYHALDTSSPALLSVGNGSKQGNGTPLKNTEDIHLYKGQNTPLMEWKRQNKKQKLLIAPGNSLNPPMFFSYLLLQTSCGIW